MASISEDERLLAEGEATEQEETPLMTGGLPIATPSHRRRRMHHVLAAALGVSALMAVVAASGTGRNQSLAGTGVSTSKKVIVTADGLQRRKHGTVSESLSSRGVVEFIEPNAQCGGTEFSLKACCMPGCACILQSMEYSQCLAPAGGQTCNPRKAADEARSAQQLAEKEFAEDRNATLQAATAKAKAERALNASATADALKYHHAEKAKEMRRHRQRKAERARSAKKAVATSARAAVAKEAEIEVLRKVISKVNRSKAIRSGGQCRPVYGQCGPVDGLKVSISEGCCIEGCTCHWKNQWFAHCLGPNGESSCQPELERSKDKERQQSLKRLEDELGNLHAVRETADHHYSRARQELAEVSLALDATTLEKQKAENAAKWLEVRALKAQDVARIAEQRRLRAHARALLLGLAAKAWQIAATNTSGSCRVAIQHSAY